MRHRFVTRWLKIRLWAGIVAGLMLLFFIQQLPLGQTIDLLMSPLVNALQTPAHWWQDINLWFTRQQYLQAENLHLRGTVQQQAGAQQEIRALRAENLRFRALLGLKALPGYRWHAARVLGRSPDRKSQRLLLRAQNTISRGDVVVSSEGLVGLVDRVQGKYAVVRTILDASMAVPVTLPGSTLAAFVRGQGETLRVKFVPFKYAPPETSILITSGAGGVFPPGIPVARIMYIHKVAGSIFADVSARPVAHWRRDAWLSIASRRGP